MTRRLPIPWPSRGLPLLLLSSALLLGGLLAASHAQVRTAITPDGTLGTTVTPQGNVYTITGGTRPGNGPNLFHSFDRFSVGTRDVASFQGPSGITNILSRVTGGQPSAIDGTLQSTIPGANLYLLNPSGVLFGPNARLDISGSFHVSTADYLRFADGATFAARLGDQSTLTVAPPVTFGFLQDNPARITLSQSQLQVPDGATLSIIGGNIQISGEGAAENPPPTLAAPGGRITLVSVASPGEVYLNLAGQTASLDVSAFRRLGSLQISNGALLRTSGDGGGTITLRGGDLLIDGARLAADTLGTRNGAPMGIDIQVSGQVVIRSAGPGLDAFITANPEGAGNAGALSIIAESVQIEASGLGSEPSSTGKAGDVMVQAREVALSDGAQISGTTSGPGQGGVVTVAATETLTLRGISPDGSHPTGIFARTTGAGAAGAVQVQAREVALSDGALISGSAFGSGQGGAVTVVATETLTLRGAGTGVLNSAQGRMAGAGAAGTVEVQARNVVLSDGAQIASSTFGPGQGGAVTVAATETLTLRGTSPTNETLSTGIFGNSGSSTRRDATGAAGTVQVQARNVVLSDGAQIASSTFGPGSGGTVTVKATETLTLRGTSPHGTSRSAIAASVEGSEATGAGGTVDVQARDILISEGGGISSSTGGRGPGGTVTVTATNTLTLRGTTPDGANPSGIFARARGLTERAGAAGTVQVQARDVVLSDGAQISSSTLGPGQGGTVTVSATNALTLTGQQSGLRTTAAGSGQGGDIIVQARAVHLTEGAAISAQSSGTGNAGTLRLQVQEQFQSAKSTITTEASQSAGGDITIEAGVVSLTKDSRITAAAMGASGMGSNGGNVTIQAAAMALNHSQVKANAFGGDGGHIRIASGVLLTDAGTCPAGSCLDASSGVGLPGTVEVRAPETEVRGAVAPLPQTFASAATLLRDRCAARLHEGTVSSLVERGRDGVPASPSGLLPSRLSGTQPAAAAPRASQQRRKTPMARQGGLQRDANGQLQIRDWPASVASSQVQEVECAAR